MDRMADIAARLLRQSNTDKQSSGAINATAFESDLVASINGVTTIGGYQSGYAKILANKCKNSLAKLVGEIDTAILISQQKGGGASVLSSLYKKFMCADGVKCNGDPRTDILLDSGKNGQMRMSVKKHGDAQISSAQAGEANAIISAALGQDKDLPALVRQIISEVLPKNSYYKIRDKYAKNTNGKPEDFDNMLGTMTGLKTGSSAPTTKQITTFNSFLLSVGVKKKVSLAIHTYMSSDNVRKKLFREFASGEKRYVPKEKNRSAEWFLQWSENGQVDIEKIDDFVDSHLGVFRMNIRDRGIGSGGSVRVDVRENWNLTYSEHQNFLQYEKLFHDEFDLHCLTEGVLDDTIDLMKTAGAAVANLYKRFVAAIKTTLSMIANLFAQGVTTVLDFFDLETTEMSYSW
jgi:hypothetical protein